MFSNIGKKCKILSKVMFAAGLAASYISGVCLIASQSEVMIIVGLLVIFGGSLVSWVISLFFHGFGELIDSNMMILRSLNGNAANVNSKSLEVLSKSDVEEVGFNKGISCEKE